MGMIAFIATILSVGYLSGHSMGVPVWPVTLENITLKFEEQIP